MRRSGQCLCGAVRIDAVLKDTEVHCCHCTQCQRWTGGGPLFIVHVTDVRVTGADAINAYHASHWGERASCATCGSTLWWKMQDRGITSVCVGMLDDQSGLSIRQEIFVDHRAPWLPAFDGARQSTEAQQKQMLADYLEGQAT